MYHYSLMPAHNYTRRQVKLRADFHPLLAFTLPIDERKGSVSKSLQRRNHCAWPSVVSGLRLKGFTPKFKMKDQMKQINGKRPEVRWTNKRKRQRKERLF